ncbi:hypothetical protein Sjap_016733 [Stephania japonica]|uniref:Uncharacterized protein n=1 Tax=Stephania japonica TaxID=461633 RepID=A0AAP0I4U9_9MAGN
MATADKALDCSSDRRKWRKIFDALVRLLQTKQTQLEDLVKERNLYEERVKIQFGRWSSEAHLLQDEIFQLKRDHSEALLDRSMEVAKSELVIGFKQRESLHHKIKLEHAERDLEDFKSCFDYLTHKCSEQKEKPGDKNKESREGKQKHAENCAKSIESINEEGHRTKLLEQEIRKLKHANEKLVSKKKSEVSALLSERDFVWNQYKKMESDYTALMKKKQTEVEKANEKIANLLTSMEHLQSSNNEKDEMIVKLEAKVVHEKSDHEKAGQAKEKLEELKASAEKLQSSNYEKDQTILKLKADLAKLEDGATKSQKEISRLAKELESLTSSKKILGTVTPVLNCCRMEVNSHGTKIQQGRRVRPMVQKEPTSSQASDVTNNTGKESRGSKKRGAEAQMSETPRLFSSTFKVPKLKKASPRIL